jgi:hypothetical protein
MSSISQKEDELRQQMLSNARELMVALERQLDNGKKRISTKDGVIMIPFSPSDLRDISATMKQTRDTIAETNRKLMGLHDISFKHGIEVTLNTIVDIFSTDRTFKNDNIRVFLEKHLDNINELALDKINDYLR